MLSKLELGDYKIPKFDRRAEGQLPVFRHLERVTANLK